VPGEGLKGEGMRRINFFGDAKLGRSNKWTAQVSLLVSGKEITIITARKEANACQLNL
jgi:hypothetical protein